MSLAEWNIDGPLGFAWTPEECAQIARAAQAFQAALPTGGGFLDHLVRVDGLGIVDSTVKVDWPQPGDATASGGIPEHLEGGEVAQWLADHPDHRFIKP